MELPPAMALVLAFVAGILFTLALLLLWWAYGLSKPKVRVFSMEIVNAGKRRVFRAVTDPVQAALDEADAPISYESSDPAVAVVERDEADHRLAKVRTLGPGLATIRGRADADLDPGEVRTLEWIVADLDVRAAPVEAQSIGSEPAGPWEDDVPV